MRVLLPLVLSIGVLAGPVRAQGQESGRPEARPGVLDGATDPVLPTAAGSPETQGSPELLPEATQLPARQPLLPFAGGKSEPQPTPLVSAEQMREGAKRLEQLRAIVVRSPRAIYLLEQARTAVDIEARRNYLRAYYTTICTRMRRLEPGLAGSIAAFEKMHIQQIGRDNDPKVPASGLASSELETKNAARRTASQGTKSSR
jgi:hypothetical protein